MDFFQAAILGIIQGLTEFLPVSSSGHLILAPRLFGWTDQGLAFDAVVHLGTLLAIIIYFRKRLWAILSGIFERGSNSRFSRRLGLLLILSVIPAGLVGFFGEEWITGHTRSVSVVAAGLIGWGIVLFFADRFNQRLAQRAPQALADTYHISAGKAAFIACAQAIAFFPGTSRSGITMTAGLFAKLNKKSAAEFSFLISIPVIFLGGMVKLFDIIQGEAAGAAGAGALSVGFLAAAASGFFAIDALMKIIQKWNYTPFVVYRIALGLFLLFFIA